jgi:hypothetical protein
VFKRADDQDRSGAATLQTAKAFKSASTYFDTLRQLGHADAEVRVRVHCVSAHPSWLLGWTGLNYCIIIIVTLPAAGIHVQVR